MPNNPDITFHAKQIFCIGSQTVQTIIQTLPKSKKTSSISTVIANSSKKISFIVSPSICSFFFLILKSN